MFPPESHVLTVPIIIHSHAPGVPASAILKPSPRVLTEQLPQASEKETSSEGRHVLGIRETHCPYGHGHLQSHTGPGTLPWTPAHFCQAFWENTASELNDLGQLYGLRSSKQAHQPPGPIWDSVFTELSLARVLAPVAVRFP